MITTNAMCGVRIWFFSLWDFQVFYFIFSFHFPEFRIGGSKKRFFFVLDHFRELKLWWKCESSAVYKKLGATLRRQLLVATLTSRPFLYKRLRTTQFPCTFILFQTPVEHQGYFKGSDDGEFDKELFHFCYKFKSECRAWISLSTLQLKSLF